MKTYRIGIFGLWRGMSFIPILKGFGDVTIAAFCEKDEGKLKSALEQVPGAKACRDFDELLEQMGEEPQEQPPLPLFLFFTSLTTMAVKTRKMMSPTIREEAFIVSTSSK